MKQATIEKIKEVLSKKGYTFFENGIFNVNLIGVRSINSKSNDFDDWLYMIFRDENLKWVIKCWPITTDPGKTYLLNPLDKSGAAIMAPGQYLGAYMIGIHGRSKPENRQYEALEQVKPMRYVRDNSRDIILDFSLFDNPANYITGVFKTNIHRASRGWFSWLKKIFPVGANGAGCQVHEYEDNFNEMMRIAKKAAQIHGNSFTYTLLNEADFS